MKPIPIKAGLLILILVGAIIYYMTNQSGRQNPGTDLIEIAVLPVNGPPNAEPSGLVMVRNQLYTISDDHDDTIYKLILKENEADMRPALTFKAGTGTPLDFEGITADQDGNFYLASETTFNILKVSMDGRKTEWLNPEIKSSGESVGLFQTNNAFLEGITMASTNLFYLCAERQPRGILKVTLGGQAPFVEAYNSDASNLPFRKFRSPDFAGLYVEEGALYALVRNAYAICTLKRSGTGYIEDQCWSYEHIVTRKENQYENMRYGRAEGLCMDEDRVFIILDNNMDSKLVDEKDTRPLLIIARRPRTD